MKVKNILFIGLVISVLSLGKVYSGEFPNVSYGTPIEQKWLPNYSVKDILQGKNSHIWIATNTGLYRYNINNVVHYDITRYTKDKYLNNEISCILEDHKGNILVGTQSGLGQFDTNTNTVKLISGRDESITSVSIGRANRILYIVGNRAVFRLTPGPQSSGYKREPVFDAVKYKKNLIKAAAELDNNDCIIGASDGLWLARGQKLYPTVIKESITTLYKEGNFLWVGTSFNGVYKCLITSDGVKIIGSFIPENNSGQIESIQEIRQFNEDGVAFATTTKIFLAHKQHFPDLSSIKEKQIFEKNSIRRILVDKTMNIWIGSRNGLFSLNPLTLLTQFNSFDNSIYQNVTINELLSLNDNNILIATNPLGLKILDTKYNKIQHVSTRFRDVKLMRKTQNGELLIVADNRFIKVHPDSIWAVKDTGKYVPQGGINDIVEVAPGEFWFSHWRNKIIRLKDKKSNPDLDLVHKEIIKAFSSNVHIYVMELDSRNNLWIGTRGEGLLRINLTNRSMKKFQRKDNFPDQILCIKEDSRNRLWVGTRDKGLLMYEPESDNFKVFNQNNGLPSNTICAIQENTLGEVWLSTLNGIAQLNESKVLSFKAYNKESGIYNAEFSFNISEAGKEGSVYFGAENGIYRFSKISQKHQGMPLEWTNIDLVKGTGSNIEQTTTDIFSKEMLEQVNETGTIILEHNQNSLQIGFAKLDYTLPKQNFYTYRLLGHDTAWSVLQGDKSMVRYFNLPPGDYVFQAMASGTDDTWDTTPKSFAIVIKPSFWQTGYAKALYVIFTVLLGFIIYKIVYRWRSINKKLEEEIESSRIHDQQMVYYADLSHEIKNRLTLIMGPLEDALKNKKVNFQMLNRIYEQGQRLKRFSDQIMNIRKSESGDFLLTVDHEKDIIPIISKIVEDARPLAMVKDINILFEPLREEITGWCDAEIVEIISMNLLNNAIKYCHPNGTVKVSLDVQYVNGSEKPVNIAEGNHLVCTISDTGIGIAKEDISKILLPFYRATDKFDQKNIPGKGIGLDLVARLIKKHHGNLEIKSEEREYTSFTFYLPIDKTAFSMNELLPDIKTQPIVIAEKNFKDNKSLIFPDANFEDTKKETQNTKKIKLLFVDDDEEMLSYLADIFKEEFLVLKAEGGEEALKIVKSNEINLIVCDLDMPDMNGLTLCGVLKNDVELAKIPFLLLTGRDSEEQKLVAFENGVDDFVEKPFRSELLSWRVKSLLKNSIQFVKPRTIVVSEPVEIIKETKTEKFIQDVIDLIEKHIDKDYLNVDYLADEMCMSRATFYRKMEEMFGESPSTFIRKYRLKKAVIYIRTGNYSLKQISDKTGFSNPKYFSKCFKSEFGVLPSAYYTEDNKEA